MLITFYLLLMLGVGRCTDDQIVDTKTVGVGDHVKLTCSCESLGNLFWIRLLPGNVPKILGKSFHSERVDPRITTAIEPGRFVLRITEAKLSDAGVYFCMKIQQKSTFLKRTDLRVEGPEPDITTVPPSDPVRPGDSVTLQCSVLSDSETTTCPGGDRVCCFRAGSDESQPSFNHIQGNTVEGNEKNLEGLSKKKCLYGFFKNVCSSDAGTYYCAVATCEEIFCENRSEPDSEVSAVHMWDSLLYAALAISLIVIAFLIYSIKKLKRKSCGCCNAAVALGTHAAAASDAHQSQQREEDSLVYSVPTFSRKKYVKAERTDAKPEQEESIYSNVKAVGTD